MNPYDPKVADPPAPRTRGQCFGTNVTNGGDRYLLRGSAALLFMKLCKRVVLGRDLLVLLREALTVLPSVRSGVALSGIDACHPFVTARVLPCFRGFHCVVLCYPAMLLRRVRHLDYEVVDVVVLGERNCGNAE